MKILLVILALPLITMVGSLLIGMVLTSSLPSRRKWLSAK